MQRATPPQLDARLGTFTPVLGPGYVMPVEYMGVSKREQSDFQKNILDRMNPVQ